MEAVKNIISSVTGNKNVLLILVLSAALIGVAVYVYMNYIQPRLNPKYVENKEILQEENNEAELYYFYTNWCPYCKKAKPEWEQLKNEFENKPINGTIIYFREIDCEKDEETPNKFNVEGYPTIKLVANGKVIEYDAKPNYDTLVEFLHTSL
jgi:thiol-disulfide isomerase/thioredoxin